MPNLVPPKNNFDNSEFDTNVGEIVGFVGLKGIVKVAPSSNNPNLFLDIKNVLLRYKHHRIPDVSKQSKPSDLSSHLTSQLKQTKANPEEEIRATVESIRLVKKQFQIQLSGYDSRTLVENFRGAQIFTPEQQLRKLSKNEWWVKDLIGMDVYSTDGKLIGTICDAPGEHGEFLEIKKAGDNKGQTIIISFVDQLFPVVDIDSRRIEMNDLPGLFD